MFKKPNPLLFLAFIALIIWPANYAAHVFASAAPNEFSALVASDEFLKGLQGRTPDGCVALAYMKDVDIIVVGSSHAYADIDPYEFSRGFAGKSVAVCALSSWNTDFFRDFFKFLEDRKLAPKRIIWLADDGSLLLLSSHEQRMTYMKAVFFDAAMRKKTTDKWAAGSGYNYEDRLAAHSAALDNLSEAAVLNILSNTELPNVAVMMTGLRNAKPNPRNDKNMRRLCADLGQRNIRLDVVMSPVPTHTSSLFSNKGETTAYLKQNLPCARRVIDKPLSQWGLDPRYFINRRLRDDYPYEMWMNQEAFIKVYEDMPEKAQKRLYDLDHMNGVGAVVFTRAMSKALQ